MYLKLNPDKTCSLTPRLQEEEIGVALPDLKSISLSWEYYAGVDVCTTFPPLWYVPSENCIYTHWIHGVVPVGISSIYLSHLSWDSHGRNGWIDFYEIEGEIFFLYFNEEGGYHSEEVSPLKIQKSIKTSAKVAFRKGPIAFEEIKMAFYREDLREAYQEIPIGKIVRGTSKMGISGEDTFEDLFDGPVRVQAYDWPVLVESAKKKRRLKEALILDGAWIKAGVVYRTTLNPLEVIVVPLNFESSVVVRQLQIGKNVTKRILAIGSSEEDFQEAAQILWEMCEELPGIKSLRCFGDNVVVYPQYGYSSPKITISDIPLVWENFSGNIWIVGERFIQITPFGEIVKKLSKEPISMAVEIGLSPQEI